MNVDIDKLRNDLEKTMLEKTECAKEINCSTGKKYELLRKKYNTLNEKYWLLQEKLDYYDSDFIGSDGEIEIKRFGNSLENMYGIYLKDSGIKIGHIDYRGYHDSVVFGDIGYVVDAKYNGHNYAYKALVLLSDYLSQNDIPDFLISAFIDNIPSLKTILKTIMNYGGDIIGIYENMVSFRCMTREKNKTKRT